MSEPLLAGWSRRFAAGGVVLFPPSSEPARGLVRIHDREPRRSLGAIVERLAPAGSKLVLTDGPRPLVTLEGEHAAFLEGRIATGAGEVQRTVGVVMGDEHFALIDGRVEDPARFQTFHDLVLGLTRSYTLGLGVDRWRPFHYQPPPGWQGVSRVRADVWLAPGFPKTRSAITVFHARPLSAAATARQHRVLYEDLTREVRRKGEARPAPPSATGLQGLMADFTGDGVSVTNLAYEDDRYVYLLRLETEGGEDGESRRAFETLVRSVRPIPRPTSSTAAPASLWIDD